MSSRKSWSKSWPTCQQERKENLAVQRKRPPSLANNVRVSEAPCFCAERLRIVCGIRSARPPAGHLWRGSTRFLHGTCAGPTQVHEIGGSTPVHVHLRRRVHVGPARVHFAMNLIIERGREGPEGSPVLEVCGSCFLSVGLFTGPRGPLRVICILAWVHASPARILRGSLVKEVMLFAWRGATRLHTALCESIRKRCGPLVWCGSTRVLEEA